MSENREEILADFQACTGVEDVAEAIYHLDESNWDLLRAVSRVMPPDTQSFRPPAVDPDIMIVEDDASDILGETPIDIAADLFAVANSMGHSSTVTKKANTPDDSFPSTSAGKSGARILKFNVQYCDRVVKVELPDTATVNDLKLRLQRDIKVSPCRQLLSSWARLAQYESTPFSKLMLPDENTLHLTVKASDGGFTSEEESSVTEKLNGTYTLNVKYEPRTFNLKYQGTKTILEVKGDVYTLTNIHVRNQVWSGWPPNIDDNTMLALCGINYPEHDLTVRRNTQSNHAREKKNMPVVQIDSDDDEFEDASESFTVDDEYFVDNDAAAAAKRTDPLIPEDVEDEIVGCITFAEQFTARYGPVHPAFYQGTLDDAIKEACSKPAKDRKILAIYLHHDASVLTNVFCTQLLGFESVMQMFENNFVLWGWDITFESNRRRLQQSVTTSLGTTAAMSLRNIPVDRLPVIILITKIRSTIEIFSVVYGNVGVNELLSSLIECVEVFTEHQRVEIKEEEERAEREFVKLEQDLAYRESLEADRAKEEAKRVQERKETETRKRLESEKALSEAKKEAFRKEVEASLPAEPPLDQGDSITKIRFRLPKGEHLERRFQTNTALKVLLDFLVVKGYPTEEFKVISSWPRRDERLNIKTESATLPNCLFDINNSFLMTVIVGDGGSPPLRYGSQPFQKHPLDHISPATQQILEPCNGSGIELTSLDKSQTLKELKLYPQETVILEER